MIIFFADGKLKAICSTEKQQVKKLGQNGAKKLRARLADLQAAECVEDLKSGRPHPLYGDRKGQFAVYLDGGVRLVFEPSEEPPPCREDGSTDWSKVSEIRIVFIGDYHD